MTIREAIERTDVLKPNGFEKAEKLRWLAELDGKIYREIMLTHHGAPADFVDYGPDTDGDTQLLVVFPYDDLYISWLTAQIDLNNREIVSYNNSIAMFNAKYADYNRYYNRTHMPKSDRLYFFLGRRWRPHDVPDAPGTCKHP